MSAAGLLYAWGRNRTGQLGLMPSSQPAAPASTGRTNIQLTRKGPVNQQYLSALMDMGIERPVAEAALQATGNQSVESAAEYIFGGHVAAGGAGGSGAAAGAEAGAAEDGADRGGTDLSDKVLVPMRLHLRDVTQVSAAGNSSGCVSRGTAFTWGEGRCGQLGHGGFESERVPRAVEALASYTMHEVGCGREHTLFLTTSGTVFAAGSTELGQLGSLAGLGQRVPTPVQLQGGVTAVVAGGFSSAIVVGGARRPATAALFEGCLDGMEAAASQILAHKARPDVQTAQVQGDIANQVNHLASIIDEVFAAPTAGYMLFTQAAPNAVGAADRIPDFAMLEGLYKRLLGTLENGVVEALLRAQNSLLEGMDPHLASLVGTERVAALVPLLVSPLLGQVALGAKLFPMLVKYLVALPQPGRELMLQWLTQVPVDVLAARLVRPCQQFITQRMQRIGALSSEVVLAIEMLAMVNEAEMRKAPEARMPVMELYNDFISEHMDVQDHYKAWRRHGTHRGSGQVDFSFCDFPFLLNSSAKSKVLRIEAQMQMAETVSQSRAEHLHKMLGFPTMTQGLDDRVLPMRRKRRLGADADSPRGGASASVTSTQESPAPEHRVFREEGLGGLLNMLLPAGLNFMGVQMAVVPLGRPAGASQGGSQGGESMAEARGGPSGAEERMSAGGGLPPPDQCGFPGTHVDACLIRIRRTHLVEDALEEIARQRVRDLAKPLKVHFIGEEGVDDGGLRKEFFQLLVQQLLHPDYGMFAYQPETRTYFFSPVLLENDHEFLLVGLAIGLAVYNGVLLDLNFPQAVYKKLLGMPVGLSDLEEMSPSVGKSLRALLEYSGPGTVQDVFCLTFAAEVHRFGEVEEVELKPGGSRIDVTEDNRAEYVELYVDHVLNKSVASRFDSFRRGFLMLAGGFALQLFRPEELEMMVCGTPHLDFGALTAATRYEGYTPDSAVVQWLWSIVEGMSIEEKKRFLKFFSGSDRAPVGGLGKLRMIIQRDGGDTHRLPTSRTCFNVLLLPEYSTKDKLASRLITAVNNAEGFGLQ